MNDESFDELLRRYSSAAEVSRLKSEKEKDRLAHVRPLEDVVAAQMADRKVEFDRAVADVNARLHLTGFSLGSEFKITGDPSLSHVAEVTVRFAEPLSSAQLRSSRLRCQIWESGRVDLVLTGPQGKSSKARAAFDDLGQAFWKEWIIKFLDLNAPGDADLVHP